MLNSQIKYLNNQDWIQFHKIDSQSFTDEPYTQEDFLSALESSNTKLFGYFIDSKIVAYLLLVIDDNFGHLSRIAVGESYQSKGIGTKLFEKLLEIANTNHIRKIKLFVLKNNIKALNLYKKFGFEITGKAWHFIIPFNLLHEKNQEFSCKILQEDELAIVCRKYGLLETIIRRYYSNSELILLTLYRDKDIVGFCRFTPSFPGAMPFILEDIKGLDFFGHAIKQHSKPQFDYFRITFEDNEELAKLCEERGYKLHHELYYMEKHLIKP